MLKLQTNKGPANFTALLNTNIFVKIPKNKSMNEEIRALEPKNLWSNFADLNEVPRPSKKEERVREFIKNFGNDLGLETIVDSVGNVIIKKPATNGM